MHHHNTDGLQKYEEFVANGYKENLSTWNDAQSNQPTNVRPQKFIKHNSNIYNPGQQFDYQHPDTKWGISPKYKNMKQEILNNAIHTLTLFEYQRQIEKVQNIMTKQFMKELQNRRKAEINWVLAVLLYCNCTDFSSNWTSTFRSSSEAQTLPSLKSKHREFYHCSKSLATMYLYFSQTLLSWCVLFWIIKTNGIFHQHFCNLEDLNQQPKS